MFVIELAHISKAASPHQHRRSGGDVHGMDNVMVGKVSIAAAEHGSPRLKCRAVDVQIAMSRIHEAFHIHVVHNVNRQGTQAFWNFLEESENIKIMLERFLKLRVLSIRVLFYFLKIEISNLNGFDSDKKF